MSETQDQDVQKFAYFLVSGEIVFTNKADKQQEINAVRQNAVIISNDGTLPAMLLGKAQENLQLNFHQRMQDANMEIRDVVLISISSLGWMSKDEFHAGQKNQPPADKAEPKEEATDGKPTLSLVKNAPDLDDAVAAAGELPSGDTGVEGDVSPVDAAPVEDQPKPV